MPLREFVGPIHRSSTRDYLARVTPSKAKNVEKALQWGFDYFDGSRDIGYHGYFYDGRWVPVAKAMVEAYGLKAGMRVLDVGCAKGFLLSDLQAACEGLIVKGIDISDYAVKQGRPDVRDHLAVGNVENGLPWPNRHFDLVVSINCLHNLSARGLYTVLQEIMRVSRGQAFICVESYKTEQQKLNLQYWQMTCEQFHRPDDWLFHFERAGYIGDYEFIYFD